MDKTEKRLMEDTVTLNGVDIHYRTIGEGPVLFLVSPGWGVASGYLQRAFSSLAKHLRLVFIDTRGSGLSGRPADPMSMGSVDSRIASIIGGGEGKSISAIHIGTTSLFPYLCHFIESDFLRSGT